MRNARQIEEEAFEEFDKLAELIRDYYTVRVDLIRAEEQVYELAKLILQMPRVRADTHKAPVWNLWKTLTNAIGTFKEIRVGPEEIEAMLV